MIVFIGPRIEESNIDFLGTGKSMPESPFDPSLVIFLDYHEHTIEFILILSRIRFHSLLFSSLYTGTKPSPNNLDYKILAKVYT